MNWPERAVNLAVEHASEIAKKITELVYYAPPEYQAQLKLIGVVLSYAGVIGVGSLMLYKLYRAAMDAIERVRGSVTALANSAGALLHRSFHTLFQEAIPAMFRTETYTRFLEWCSMTDREAIGHFAPSTRPRLAQHLLGFVVLLATVYAGVAFGCAAGFVLSSEQSSNTAALSMNQSVAVLAMAVLFAFFIGAFDRSIAGSGRLFQWHAHGPLGNAHTASYSWRRRSMAAFYNLATLDNLRGISIVLVRVGVCWMSASFVANVLVIYLFKASIEMKINKEADKTVQAFLVARKDAPAEVKAFEMSSFPACQSYLDEKRRLEQALKKEEERTFQAGPKKGSHIGDDYKYFEKELKNINQKIETACPSPSEEEEQQTLAERQLRLKKDQDLKREAEEKTTELKKFDLSKGLDHAKDMPGYSMLYWLLFSIEMLVLAVKLTLRSSYDDALDMLEIQRRAQWSGSAAI